MQATVNKNRCPQNHRCPAVQVCPVDAIHQEGFSLPKIDADKCIACQKCTKFCPRGAIKVTA